MTITVKDKSNMAHIFKAENKKVYKNGQTFRPSVQKSENYVGILLMGNNIKNHTRILSFKCGHKIS